MDNGHFTTIDAPDASFTQPNGINNRGQIVGEQEISSISASLIRGFLFDGKNFTTINVPGSLLTIAAGINNSSQIVGQLVSSCVGPGEHGFLAIPVNEEEDED